MGDTDTLGPLRAESAPEPVEPPDPANDGIVVRAREHFAADAEKARLAAEHHDGSEAG